MPLQSTSGAASYDAFGGGVAVLPKFIEDYFSTYLYSGTSANQTITNGIDLSTKGGLVWIKTRNQTYNHYLTDSASGIGSYLSSNATNAQNIYGAQTDDLTSFNTNGFSLGADGNLGWVNATGSNMVSWSWAKAPKFFDVLTYTGTGSTQNISHNLGSTPGCIFVKRTDSSTFWAVYHTSLGNTKVIFLNDPDVAATSSAYWNNTSPTSTNFTVGTDSGVNANGGTYVAYLFAHDAGGFGLTGTDNVISCGSFTTDGSGNATVSLGYEPAWVMIKRTDSSTGGGWSIYDTMRGWSQSNWALLSANTSNSESNGTGSGSDGIRPTATGFQSIASATPLYPSASYIYIAIRRGPMKVPTSGTSVFNTALRTTGNPNFVAGFPIDMSIYAYRPGATGTPLTISRLTNKILVTNETSAEVANDPSLNYDQQLGYGSGQSTNSNVLSWMWRRAPSFFDVVCYTGTGATNNSQPHNLGVVPELIIVKRRSGAASWQVYSATYGRNFYAFLDLTQGFASDPGNAWGTTDPTSTTFSLSPLTETNASGSTYVAYLFASCPGVSKVGSYTGTGTTKQIDCGFTGGARFVLIKRTDSTGDWYVWDSARGIVSGNDPYLLLNSTAAEVTNTDYVDTYSAGFEISSTAPAAINASGGTFIFLAIA